MTAGSDDTTAGSTTGSSAHAAGIQYPGTNKNHPTNTIPMTRFMPYLLLDFALVATIIGRAPFPAQALPAMPGLQRLSRWLVHQLHQLLARWARLTQLHPK